MSLRIRWFLVPALVLAGQTGCQNLCWWKKKPDCSGPPPGAPIIAPVPGSYGGAPTPAGGNVLMPAPLPPNGTPAGPPAPPPPNFPSGPSYYPPVASFYTPLPPGSQAGVRAPAAPTKPPVRLLPPESPAQTPAAGLSESASVPAASTLPVGISEFIPVTPDSIANGRKPTLDGLDWLKTAGYKSVVFVRRPEVSDTADRKQFEQRGLTFSAVEVDPATLSWATVEAFARAVGDSASQPVFVYDADGSLTGGLWYLYFRRYERLSDDAAKLRAARLGWREHATEGAARDMAEAVKKLSAQS